MYKQRTKFKRHLMDQYRELIKEDDGKKGIKFSTEIHEK